MAKNKLDTRESSKREHESREASMRPERWKTPSKLPTPNPQKGWVFRWIRVSMFGKDDPTNVSAKLREGWEPCKAKDHPEIQMVHTENQDFKDNIVMGGMMLCKAPKSFMKGRKEHFEQLTASQMRTVNENLMRESDPRMPVFNNSKTEVTFGKGSRK